MGRTKGSKNKPKGPVTNSTYPSNGGPHATELNEDQRRALLTRHVVIIERYNAQIKTIQDEIKKERSQTRNDGFELKGELDHMLQRRKDHKSGKLGEVLERELKQARVDRWMNIRKGKEPGLFEQDQATDDTAYEDGKIAAAEGFDCKPPDHLRNDGVASPHQRWISGWHAMKASMDAADIHPSLVEAMDDAIKADNGHATDEVDLRPHVLKERERQGVYGTKPPDPIGDLVTKPEDGTASAEPR